jgi:hypothetical protein
MGLYRPSATVGTGGFVGIKENAFNNNMVRDATTGMMRPKNMEEQLRDAMPVPKLEKPSLPKSSELLRYL